MRIFEHVIKIEREIEFVFKFITNPKNTHKWIDDVKKEWVDTPKIGVGTLYFQQASSSEDNSVSVFQVKEFESNKKILFLDTNSKYWCEYVVIAEKPKLTRLIYREPMSGSNSIMKIRLEKLKTIISKESK